MHLLVDIGNTTIACGFYEKTLLNKYVLTVDINKSSDELVDIMSSFISRVGYDPTSFDYALLSSVVPSMNFAVKAAIKKLFPNCNLLTLGAGIKTNLNMKVDNPHEVGADLIADLVAAKGIYGYPTLIIDLGTVTKVLLLDKDGAFSSAIFFPGIDISVKTLTKNAALLPETSLETLKPVSQSRQTLDAISSGIIYGHVGAIKEIVNRYESELGYSVKKVITGGCYHHLASLLPNDFIYNENLVFDGLELILNKNI